MQIYLFDEILEVHGFHLYLNFIKTNFNFFNADGHAFMGLKYFLNHVTCVCYSKIPVVTILFGQEVI